MSTIENAPVGTGDELWSFADPILQSLARYPQTPWISYHSNESGRNEIYVQPFPGPGRKSQISTNGGSAAKWRSDGREMFFMAPDNRLMAVPINLPSDGSAPQVGAPVALFSVRRGSQYDVSPDGQRFLINMPLEGDVTAPITVIINWAGQKE